MATEMHIILLLVFAAYFTSAESTVKSSKMKVDFGINLPSMSFNIPSMGMPKMQITAIVGRKKSRKPIKIELPQISLHAKSLEDPWSNQNEGQYNNQGGGYDSGYQEDNYEDEGYDSDKENDEEYERQGQGYQGSQAYGQGGGREYRPSGNEYQQGEGGYSIRNNGYQSEGGYQQDNGGYQSGNIHQAVQYSQINKGYSGKNDYQAGNGGYGVSSVVYKLEGDSYQAVNGGNRHSNGRYQSGNQMYGGESYRLAQPIRNNANIYNINHRGYGGMPSNQYQSNGIYNEEAVSYRPQAPNNGYHLVPARTQIHKPYGNTFPNYGGGHADYNQDNFRQNNYISDNSIEYSNSNGYNSYTGQDSHLEPKKNYAKDKEVIVYSLKPKKVTFVDQQKNYGANKYYKREGEIHERINDRYQASNQYKRSNKLQSQSGWKPVNTRY